MENRIQISDVDKLDFFWSFSPWIVDRQLLQVSSHDVPTIIDWKIWWMLKMFKCIRVKDSLPLIPPQNHPSQFKHIYLIIPGAYWSSSGSVSWIVLGLWYKTKWMLLLNFHWTERRACENMMVCPHSSSSPDLAPGYFGSSPKPKWPWKVNVFNQFRTWRQPRW